MAGEMPVEITVEPEGGGVVVRVAGEVDIATSPALRDACLGAVEQGGDVVLDLAGVTFLDSSGISVLVQARQRLDSLGRRLEIRAASRPVRRVLELAGLDATLGLRAEPSRDGT
jgi:anti-sigma B factor antagonist